MERDYIAGLYRSLGMSVGAEFTSEDVRLLYQKVFHAYSDNSEANAAIRKITGGDNSYSCNGENILEVLLEMESEREKKEMLHWDLQLLNAGNLTDMMNWMQQNTDTGIWKMAYNSDSASLQPCTAESASNHTGKRKKEACGQVASVRKLKKAARQCWASLASAGVQSIFPSVCQGQKTGMRCQAWGCVSMSDLLLLVEVKYDVVAHLLYAEMLQQHHTENVWERLLPWQQHKLMEELEELAGEALESVDVLRMSELPGAFRMYQETHTRIKASMDGSVRSRPQSKSQSWSAVSFLNDLHTYCQQERQTLTVLSERLPGESLRLICLHIRLATLRAQRENESYGALLAARQSFHTWPHVDSPCRAEQVTLWLYGDEGEQEEVMKEDMKSPQERKKTWVCSQHALLQLLVLTQEQERKHLVKLLNEVSQEDLQGPARSVPSLDESHTQAALRNGCVRRLRQICAWLQSHGQCEMQFKSQFNLEDCASLLLTHLAEVQEIQASLLLQALIEENTPQIQALQDKYKSEIRAQFFSNLHHLLTSDDPLPSGSGNYPSLIENSNIEDIKAESSYKRQDEAQNVTMSDGESVENKMVDSSKESSRELKEVQTSDDSNKQDVCSGCGAAIEDLPYLEILCAKRDIEETLPAEGGAQTEEEESATKTLQSYEEQASLITLAWSKPPEDSTDDDEVEAGHTGPCPSVESSTKNQIQPTGCEKNQERHEERDITVLQSTTAQHHDAQPANLQCSTLEQGNLNTTPFADQPEKKEVLSEQDPQTNAPETEVLQGMVPPHLADPTESDPHGIDICSGTSGDTTNTGQEETEVEMCPTGEEFELWDQREPEAPGDCSISELKTTREPTLIEKGRCLPVSAVEREKTMRNLVDMQRKFEQKQQRDRERQMLRVQERLSIVQNRKAEEDLLGLKHTDRLKHLTHDLPLEDRNQQKTIVRERLEQLRRERSYIMQSKRDKNTAGFRELLGPGVIHSRETEEGADWDTTTV